MGGQPHSKLLGTRAAADTTSTAATAATSEYDIFRNAIGADLCESGRWWCTCDVDYLAREGSRAHIFLLPFPLSQARLRRQKSPDLPQSSFMLMVMGLPSSVHSA